MISTNKYTDLNAPLQASREKISSFRIKLSKGHITHLAIIVILFILGITPIINTFPNVNASSGVLKGSSIKTCPDGNVYGKHGADNHWHLAQKSDDGKWHAIGDSISDDPCPSSNEKPTVQSDKNEQPSDNDASNSSIQQPTSIEQETIIRKSNNTNILNILVNGESINNISNNMTYHLADDTIDEIIVKLADENATYVLSDYGEDFTDRNSITKVMVTVTAEDGTNKIYNLKLVKKPSDLLFYVWLDNNLKPIEFDNNNTYTTSVLAYKNKICMDTRLSNDKAKVIVHHDNKDTNDCVNLQIGNNTIVLQVADQYGDIYEYNIVVERKDVVTTIFTSIILWLICCAMLALSGIILRNIIRRLRDKKKILPLFRKNSFTKEKIHSLAIKIYTPPIAIYLNTKRKQKSSISLKIWLVVWIVFTMAFLGGICGANGNTSNVNKENESPSATIIYEPAKEEPAEGAALIEETESAQADKQIQTSGSPMSGIVIAEATDATYTRNDYEPSWSVGYGCDIRARILQSTSVVSYQTGENGCTVTYGSWVDPYTGKTLTGNPYRGDGTENDLDIDHIIPLKYVNSHGGSNWSASEKRAYGASLAAMDNGVYVAVSASENRSKSDKGPSAYYPPNPDYKCTYAQKWRDIAKLYSISISKADYDVLEDILISCDAQ